MLRKRRFNLSESMFSNDILDEIIDFFRDNYWEIFLEKEGYSSLDEWVADNPEYQRYSIEELKNRIWEWWGNFDNRLAGEWLRQNNIRNLDSLANAVGGVDVLLAYLDPRWDSVNEDEVLMYMLDNYSK
jgi:hypothetical protein